MTRIRTQIEKDRRFRYAVGFMIEQEGTGVVERLVEDGTKTRFGVKESWVPGRDLSDLTRDDAEDLLKEREWQFYGYDEVDALTVSTKIFDTHITFSPQTAISEAQSALRELGFDAAQGGALDRPTRQALEEAAPQDFFDVYIGGLENLVESSYGGKEALLRRVRQVPYRNVDASDTKI